MTKPPGLKKLIITDSLASAELWAKAQAQQLAEFPKEVQEGLAVGFNDVPTYRAAMGVFFAVHGCTVKPWPRELNASFDYLFGDPTVNIKMSVNLHHMILPTPSRSLSDKANPTH